MPITEMTMDCSICVETFNRSTHRSVACPACQKTACHQCVQTNLLQNTVMVPKCMFCPAEWNMEFLRSSLSRSFMDKEYRDHQKNALLAEAEAHVGNFQQAAKNEERKEATQREIHQIKQEMRHMRIEMDRLRHRLYQTQRLYWDLDREDQPLETGTEAEASRADFFMACPRDDCRGRISTGYKCGLCEHFFCAQCHACKGLARDAVHECKKEDVDTVKALRDNTKHCPNDKCRMLIFKESGCDQMWCTSCHTCFSWRSGNILNGVIHNPHFYEFQRRNGGEAARQPGDIPCGGMPSTREMNVRARQAATVSDRAEILYDVHRVVMHLTDITMPRVFTKFNRRTEIHRTTGIKYLRGLITREMWRNQLYYAVRQEERFRRYYQVLEMLTTNIAELLRQYVAGTPTSTIAHQCEALFAYTNLECAKIKKQFNMVLPTFSPTMDVANV